MMGTWHGEPEQRRYDADDAAQAREEAGPTDADATRQRTSTEQEWADWLARQVASGECSACGHPLHRLACAAPVTVRGWGGVRHRDCGCGGDAACARVREVAS